MKENRSPIVFTFIVWLIWLAIVIGGEIAQAGGPTGLDALVSTQIVISLVVAPLFLLAVVAYKKWWKEVGLKAPDNTRDLRLLSLPALALLVMLVMGITGGISSDILIFILINTLLVGISEELMMRGILFHGVSFGRSAVQTVWITAVLFGLMHALNGFLTGAFAPAIFQAVLATGFGVWIGALRIRLNTILPLMVLHWLWDFSVFSLSQGISVLAQYLPIAFALVLFLYGLWLLRGYQPAETGEPAMA